MKDRLQSGAVIMNRVKHSAQDAMNGWDPTNGCIFYYNPNTATNKWIWSKTIVTKIGKHNFCK